MTDIGREVIFLYLAMIKHSILYEKDFLGTIDKDAKEMFDILKEVYENKIKGTNAPYAQKFGESIVLLERNFD